MNLNEALIDFFQATWPSEERFDKWKTYSNTTPLLSLALTAIRALFIHAVIENNCFQNKTQKRVSEISLNTLGSGVPRDILSRKESGLLRLPSF
jgi:hypothetical protein